MRIRDAHHRTCAPREVHLRPLRWLRLSWCMVFVDVAFQSLPVRGSDTRSVRSVTRWRTRTNVNECSVMSERPSQNAGGSGSSPRQKITSALQMIRKNAVYRSIVMRLGHAVDTPKKCKKSPAKQQTLATDDGGFGDWRTEGLPEHSHRRPSPPCAVSRSVSDYGVVRSSTRRPHTSDTRRVEEAYRRGFCDGSVADVFLMRQTSAVHQQQKQLQSTTSGRRRRLSSMEFTDGSPWMRLSSSSTAPAGLSCGSVGSGEDRVPSKTRVANTPIAAAVFVHKSLPTSASRFQRHRRLSLPVSSASDACYSSQSSVDVESPSATVPTKAAAIALHQLIECYRNGYRVSDHKIALMLDILDTQQRLAKVKFERLFSFPFTKVENVY